MSFTMVAKAKKITAGCSGEKFVLMMLADIADDKGRCFPSYSHIADACQLSRRSVIRYINSLQESGLISIEYRKQESKKLNKSNIFTLHLDSDTLSPPSDTQAPPSDTLSPPPSDTLSPRTYHSSEPINEPINNSHSFDEFWNCYPGRKSNKANARKAYKKAIKKISHQGLMNILINQKKNNQFSDPQYIPLASSWLNGERWEDELLQNTGVNHAAYQQFDNSALGRVKAENARRASQREKDASCLGEVDGVFWRKVD